MAKKIAVIGANGFLGHRVVENLARKDYDILAVYNRSRDKLGDVENKIQIKDFLSKKDKTVSHIIFAAGNYRNSAEENAELNCEVLYPITRLYSNSKIIYISSTSVYGSHDTVITEGSSFKGSSLYGLANLAGESIVMAHQSYGIIRLAYLYGPGLDNGSYIPMTLAQAKNGKIKVIDKGQRKQDYFHVNDAAELCIQVTEHNENDIFLGATGDSISNCEVADKITEYYNCEVELIEEEEKSPSLFFDPSSTFRRLNWSPKVTFAYGIKDLIL